mmetsp:Transcript_76/g.638  ORF Transcript_76/g.638 Transcript_76/m.638 type:complete len:109 (-) Transcript_76:1490-1816(-)
MGATRMDVTGKDRGEPSSFRGWSWCLGTNHTTCHTHLHVCMDGRKGCMAPGEKGVQLWEVPHILEYLSTTKEKRERHRKGRALPSRRFEEKVQSGNENTAMVVRSTVP